MPADGCTVLVFLAYQLRKETAIKESLAYFKIKKQEICHHEGAAY